jgi:hypothetical protein
MQPRPASAAGERALRREERARGEGRRQSLVVVRRPYNITHTAAPPEPARRLGFLCGPVEPAARSMRAAQSRKKDMSALEAQW